MTWIPSYMQAMAAYLANPNVSGMYGQWDSPTPGYKGYVPGEGGVDFGAPIGTPVYALADGQIVGAGYWNDDAHGVVTTRINVPGSGQQDLYYQHITLDPSITDCTGSSCTQTVKAGQQIGTVGPYGETEMGFNANWGGIWGTNHPGPWAIDPRPMLAAILTNSVNNNGNIAQTSTGGNFVGSTGTGGPVGTSSVPAWGIKSRAVHLCFGSVGIRVVALVQAADRIGGQEDRECSRRRGDWRRGRRGR